MVILWVVITDKSSQVVFSSKCVGWKILNLKLNYTTLSRTLLCFFPFFLFLEGGGGGIVLHVSASTTTSLPETHRYHSGLQDRSLFSCWGPTEENLFFRTTVWKTVWQTGVVYKVFWVYRSHFCHRHYFCVNWLCSFPFECGQITCFAELTSYANICKFSKCRDERKGEMCDTRPVWIKLMPQTKSAAYFNLLGSEARCTYKHCR